MRVRKEDDMDTTGSTRAERAVPPPYYHLWHLAALNVVTAEFEGNAASSGAKGRAPSADAACPRIRSTVWDRIAAEATHEGASAVVALVDVGVSARHPNLRTRLDRERSIDLASHPYGARTTPPRDGEEASPFAAETPVAFFEGLDIGGLEGIDLPDADDRAYLDDLVASYAASRGVERTLTSVEETFASHGTCCAGLIVAEPAAVGTDGEATAPETAFGCGGTPVPNRNANVVPYFGVDPFSRLLSVRTSFENDADQFIAAFLYAWHRGADVIVLPRGIPDPVRSHLRPKPGFEEGRDRRDARERADLLRRIALDQEPRQPDPEALLPRHDEARAWKVLRSVLLAISRHVPIVCAAGNDGESQLIYPANLATPENGIIAVGAVTAEGFRAGYANYGDGLTLVAPSNDGEVLNRHQIRLDPFDPASRAFLGDGSDPRIVPFSTLELMTTDLPGAFGYEAGAAPGSTIGVAENPGVGGGYYAGFGGTSGAAALIGGVTALCQRARRSRGLDRLGGVEMKTILVEASSRDRAVAPGLRPLTRDSMNAADESSLVPPAAYFGAGVPDASEAVGLALDH